MSQIVIPLLLLSAASAFGIWLLLKPDPLPSAQAIAIDEVDLNFGEVTLSSAFEHSLTLRNTTDKTVRVKELRATCGCTRVTPATFDLVPNGSRSIHLSLDLSVAHPNDDAVKARPFAVSLIAMIERDSGEVSPQGPFELRGYVVSPLIFSQSSLTFGDGDVVSNERTISRSVTITGRSTLSKLELSSSSPLAELALERLPSPNGSFRLTVSPNRTLPAGMHRIRALFAGSISGGRHFRDIPFDISIPVSRDVEFTPPSLALGVKRLGLQERITIALHSKTGRSYRIVGCDLVDSKTQRSERIVPVPDEPAARFRIPCTISITKEGSQQLLVRILLTSAADKIQTSVELPIYYHGMPSSTFVE